MARPRPLAEIVDPLIAPAAARQGFADADILLSWPEIVGERLAGWSQPLKVEWKKRGPDGHAPEPATLVVRVASAFAIELQHTAPILIERINAFYGWNCVGRIVLKQGPVRTPRSRRPPVPEPGPEARAAIRSSLSGLDEPALRGALDRLGEAVLGEADARHRQGGGGMS